MNRKTLSLCALGFLLMGASCTSHYKVVNVDRTRVVIDERFDKAPDSAAIAFLAPYKQKVDSISSPVVGKTEMAMEKGRPESRLSNLLSDILVWGADRLGEKADFALYNMGGIRATIAKGDVTYGDILDVAPFENKLCMLTLTGDKVMQLMSEIAENGGEGVSSSIRMVITEDGKLESVTIGGKEIDKTKKYRVATIDYLAQGNDGLTALADGTDVSAFTEDKYNTRFIIMDYFKTMMNKGKAVKSEIEGRITVK